MSATPSETELQTQWKNAIALLESARNYADGTVAGSGNLLDTLEQSLEGVYTPGNLALFASTHRAALSGIVEPAVAREVLETLLFEYGGIITNGSGYEDAESLMRALQEHFHANTLSVKSRDITFDTTATTGKIPSGSIVGNGSLRRLTTDERGYDIEFCHVETKRFRCRQDQNNGVKEHAEVFEHLGQTPSPDALLRQDHASTPSYGSGTDSEALIQSRHAGTQEGGSLAKNSSFSTYSATSTPKFTGWDLSGTGAAGNVTQDTTNFYRSYPNAPSDASLKITADASNTFTFKQTITSMQIAQLDPEVPYFFRIMWNREVGSAANGTLTIRMGSQSADVTIAAQTGWQELVIPIGTACWFRNFNQDPFDIEIEWACSSSTGFLLIDDAIFCEWDEIDGTYWLLTGGTTPWLVDDTLTFTDTGGAPADAKIQWWLFISGLGYLPSVTGGSETFADP